MYSYKRWMVGVDFTGMDPTVISYTSFLAKLLRPEKIYFINVQADLEIPTELKEAVPEFHEPRDEMLKHDMVTLVDQHFEAAEGTEVDYKVVEGSPRRELLRWTNVKDIDLILVGRKKLHQGTGIIPSQLSRKALCSVLFVPETPPESLGNLWVAADFSPNSQMALEEALSISRNNEDAKVWVHNVYTVPMGYYKTGKTEEQFAQIMLGHAQKRYEQFLEDIEGSTSICKPVYTFDHNRASPANHIISQAKDHESDLILVGARGRNLITALVLGSVAEKLIKINDDIPLLLVKKKDGSLDLSSWMETI